MNATGAGWTINNQSLSFLQISVVSQIGTLGLQQQQTGNVPPVSISHRLAERFGSEVKKEHVKQFKLNLTTPWRTRALPSYVGRMVATANWNCISMHRLLVAIITPSLQHSKGIGSIHVSPLLLVCLTLRIALIAFSRLTVYDNLVTARFVVCQNMYLPALGFRLESVSHQLVLGQFNVKNLILDVPCTAAAYQKPSADIIKSRIITGLSAWSRRATSISLFIITIIIVVLGRKLRLLVVRVRRDASTALGFFHACAHHTSLKHSPSIAYLDAPIRSMESREQVGSAPPSQASQEIVLQLWCVCKQQQPLLGWEGHSENLLSNAFIFHALSSDLRSDRLDSDKLQGERLQG